MNQHQRHNSPTNGQQRSIWMFLLACLFLLFSQPADAASSDLPLQLKGVQVKNSLGRQISLQQLFTDHTGTERTLKHFFSDAKPVILTLNYYRCPMLCSKQLNGLVMALKRLPKKMHKQFRIVTISFNGKETPKLAKAKRKSYLKLLGKTEIEWHFLVGKQREIDRLTKTLRFSYRYVAKANQFAHPSVLYLMTPKGKVSQYLAGLTYNPRDLRFSLITASSNKIGTLIDQFVMSCFVYNVVDGKYTAFAFGMVRLGGGLTVCFLVIFLGVFWLQERKRQQVEKTT